MVGTAITCFKPPKGLKNAFLKRFLSITFTGLGNLKSNATRKEYTRKVKVMAKVRRLIVDVIGGKECWCKFAVKVKQDNLRRLAFQEKFASQSVGWKAL